MYLGYINGWIEQYEVIYAEEENKSNLWDLIKCELRRATIAYCKTQSRLKKQMLVDLGKELSSLESQICTDPNQDKITRYQIIKSETEKLYSERSAGAHLRAKATEVEFDEKNSTYFSNLEKSHAKTKHIAVLEVNGNDVTDANAILQEEKSFYETLYASRPTSSFEQDCFLQNIAENAPKLSEDHKNFMDKQVSIAECSKALKALPNSKSPGSDGFTTEFYKVFWSKIKF